MLKRVCDVYGGTRPARPVRVRIEAGEPESAQLLLNGEPDVKPAEVLLDFEIDLCDAGVKRLLKFANRGLNAPPPREAAEEAGSQ